MITPPVKKIDVGPREVLNNGFVMKQIPGRGNGLVATRAIETGEQIMFVNKPLALFITPISLNGNCHQCYLPACPPIEGSSKYTAIGPIDAKLLDCKACHMVKYCSKECQKLSWYEHHKYECPILVRNKREDIEQRNFTDRRGAIKILLNRKRGVIVDDIWTEVLALESHVEKVLAHQGRGPRLVKDSIALRKLTDSPESVATIQRLLCVVEANKFAVELFGTPVAQAFDPLPSLMNHDCNPNAHIRFDISKH